MTDPFKGGGRYQGARAMVASRTPRPEHDTSELAVKPSVAAPHLLETFRSFIPYRTCRRGRCRTVVCAKAQSGFAIRAGLQPAATGHTREMRLLHHEALRLHGWEDHVLFWMQTSARFECGIAIKETVKLRQPKVEKPKTSKPSTATSVEIKYLFARHEAIAILLG